jgi:hypothetical protein
MYLRTHCCRLILFLNTQCIPYMCAEQNNIDHTLDELRRVIQQIEARLGTYAGAVDFYKNIALLRQEVLKATSVLKKWFNETASEFIPALHSCPNCHLEVGDGFIDFTFIDGSGGRIAVRQAANGPAMEAIIPPLSPRIVELPLSIVGGNVGLTATTAVVPFSESNKIITESVLTLNQFQTIARNLVRQYLFIFIADICQHAIAKNAVFGMGGGAQIPHDGCV